MNTTTNGNETAGLYIEVDNMNFDGNMVIILVALLCALICALGLNSIVRCFLRCDRILEMEDEEAGRSSLTGLKKELVKQIPMVIYKSGLNIIPATECPICLGEFAEGEEVRILPRCCHGFHVNCIDKWLFLHSSCPTCRQQLIENSGTAAVVVVVH